jgi:hypothetical protein
VKPNSRSIPRKNDFSTDSALPSSAMAPMKN